MTFDPGRLTADHRSIVALINSRPFESRKAPSCVPAEHPAQEVRALEGHLHPQLPEERRDAGGGAYRHGAGPGSRWAALIPHRHRHPPTSCFFARSGPALFLIRRGQIRARQYYD